LAWDNNVIFGISMLYFLGRKDKLAKLLDLRINISCFETYCLQSHSGVLLIS